ncbi:SDR family oxidoreductase [Paenibacillus sp. JCM 10914]|uniref:SDR family NAD(P)-dependent oxidoreductase n=1 Tax=Paenibacillus sp. JCM 10914 TaxID=1236974 RepID=UPI0003CC7AC6|nr:SDR family oxidoreductase [Paenibacillus sp. JCM 10914]GAE08781.1 rRNA small subunit 7-methylguanosine (m7G) methyltransferase GidB [Paenibacillus sp. JCM 10914]
MMLEDQVCIITGGGSGIGEVAAERFAEEGASVIIVDIDEAGGQRVAESISSKPGRRQAYVIKADVSSEQDVQRAVAEVEERFGRIDILFNNAATILPKELEEVTVDEWTRVININLKSVFLMIKTCIPALRKSKGNIVNMASLNGLVGQKQNAVYASTKGAIVALTKALALDYAPDGVRVNCLCPAGVMTPLLEKWRLEQDDPEETTRLLNNMHPLGRPADSEEIADAALFLASRGSRFVTGVALPVDGGASLGY